MCGILAIVSPSGRPVGIEDSSIVRMRDTMTHRGPDDAGLWKSKNVAFAHRRLVVIDPTPDGHQPFVSSCGRYALVYNGELYNDAQLRRELSAEGVACHTHCDTETVFLALQTWGKDALTRFRGMFSLCFFDTRTDTMLAARDPLGIKPLYFAQINGRLVLASEIPAILAHPEMSAQPNLPMVSAYLTTIRTVLGSQTLFEGISAIEPGQCLVCNASGDALRITTSMYTSATPVGGWLSEEDAARQTSTIITDSVQAHLRSDVPLCALLSGGLDSTITASIASKHLAVLRTYCAGTPDGTGDDDLAWADKAAAALGTHHARATIDCALFRQRWPELVEKLGVPLSTPNEVAIFTVATRLREDGCIVTLSGEGADELFAGYEPPMDSAWQFTQQQPDNEGGGTFQLLSNAWISPELKSSIFQPRLWETLSRDAWLIEHYEQQFARCAVDAGPEAAPWQAHLRFHQRVNLTGLLQRLDTATMQASVEGRTPFADIRVAQFANSLQEHHLYTPPGAGAHDDAAVLTVRTSRTKRILRDAMGALLPPGIAARPKASFPLPFVDWLPDHAPAVRSSALLDAMLKPDAIDVIARDPVGNWQCAWPMLNIALWSSRHWS